MGIFLGGSVHRFWTESYLPPKWIAQSLPARCLFALVVLFFFHLSCSMETDCSFSPFYYFASCCSASLHVFSDTFLEFCTFSTIATE